MPIYTDNSENAGTQQIKTLFEQLALIDAVEAKTQLGTGNNPAAPNQGEAKRLMTYLVGVQAKKSFTSKGFKAIT